MNDDLLNFPDDAPFDPSVINDVKDGVRLLGKDLLVGKMAEAKLLREAQAEAGIGSKEDAIYTLMDYLNIGIRALAAKVKVPRKKFVRMIEGHIPMPPEVQAAMEQYFKQENKKQKKNLSFDFDKG